MTDIQEMPLSVPHFRRKVEDFLGRNDLRLEDVDVYLTIQDPEGEILAGGGLKGDVIKCVAVSESARSQGLSAPLFSRLISIASERGITNLKAFTKPKNESVFASLGFHTLAYAPKAILMENGRGLESYLEYLGKHRKDGRNGAIVIIFPQGLIGRLRNADEARPRPLRAAYCSGSRDYRALCGQ